MRWWARLLLTIVLTPPAWQLFVDFVASQQGSSWSELLAKSASALAGTYLAFTLPALALCGLLLVCDLVLGKLGLSLLTVAVSPLLAGLAAAFALRLAPNASAGARESVIFLALLYGEIWGLTIREPKQNSARRTLAADVDTQTST